MIETYRLSHNGGQDKYCDDVLVRVIKEWKQLGMRKEKENLALP